MEPAPGAYAALPVWRSREHYLQVVVPLALQLRPDALEIRDGGRARRVRLETFMAWISAEAEAADGATGRGIRITPKQISERLGRSERTVQTCRAAARRLGLLVDVVAGRQLSLIERLEAYANGSRQRGLANESALTVPSWLRPHLPHHEHPVNRQSRSRGSLRRPRRAVDNQARRRPQTDAHVQRCTPPSGPEGPPPSSSSPMATPTTFATSAMAASPAQTPRAAPNRPRPQTTLRAGTRLARALIARIPWLRGTQPGRIAPLVAKFERARLTWRANDIVAAIDATNARMGWTSLTSAHIRTTSYAVLAHYLTPLDVDADHPRLHVELAADARRAETADRRAAIAANEAQKSCSPADRAAEARAILQNARREATRVVGQEDEC